MFCYKYSLKQERTSHTTKDYKYLAHSGTIWVIYGSFWLPQKITRYHDEHMFNWDWVPSDITDLYDNLSYQLENFILH